MDVATGAFGGTPYGATNRVKGVPKWVARTHVDPPPYGAFGGTPYGATNRVRGVPKWDGHAESKGKEGEEGGGRRGEERNAGHRLSKTRTQHHRMVGKNVVTGLPCTTKCQGPVGTPPSACEGRPPALVLTP